MSNLICDKKNADLSQDAEYQVQLTHDAFCYDNEHKDNDDVCHAVNCPLSVTCYAHIDFINQVSDSEILQDFLTSNHQEDQKQVF